MPPNATAGGQSITDSLLSAAATAAAESEQNPTKLQQDSTGVLFECDAETIDGGLVKDIVSMKKADRRKLKLVWRNIIAFGYLHLAAVYGAWLIFTSAKWQTIVLAFALYVVSGLGITAGAHRLWAHRSYKAKWPLRVLLVIFNTVAFQDAAYHWARDHRVHHKYSETDADPHNATRGFFFSHIGWLLCKKHPEVKAKGKGVDLSDLRADPVLMFQKKHYFILMPLACFILPTVAPMYFWGESFVNAWFVATMFRWCFILNVTWLVNSAAHKFGGRPYDRFINPSENISVAMLAFGEGWHNYHHVFPWDYKTAEFGKYSLNLTTAFIDFFAKIGWAYDLKSVSPDIIKKRVKRTGDGTHATWGWGDKDQPKEEIDDAVITHKKSE
ncbi:acyl-CoA Delta-9 desaturase [Drosophila mojavensis]|uniref:Desaturase 1, isoform A n=2 Tax=Drosophila mojavensis TaxID=7230 RepID=B4K744_DROMO|nr:acyl-CoA Delta-9 desaturase [Drosophila mojavensis]XP_015023166.1 acyl-CoA Delta-9 desaturase [Drosophila mojavensis]XP_015023167.1 acyl-CoA Delta-9 desaturase [Drosophila mojavensis]EDW16357.1 desaturase 1, isoform A [Drosophila mojavensis]KRG02060.1 desaturase 1, isoform B [Drosophila mojavensis]KRG02061.1 desaturase 1, isoform C [Drosophila mojavensis]